MDELVPEPGDYRVDKYRNTDQCVMCSLEDANFLGYGCVLLEDCRATTSPEFCSRATIWNVEKCFGFVSRSQAVLDALAQVT